MLGILFMIPLRPFPIGTDEGVMGIGTAIAALIMGRRSEGFSFALNGTTGSVVSLVAFAVLGWILFRTASSAGRNGAA